MKNGVRIIKAVIFIDIAGGFIFFIWSFSTIIIRQCGMYIACPSSPLHFSGLLSYPEKLIPDFYIYALVVSLGHAMLWVPNFILSLSCYRHICFSDWLLVRDIPSFQTFMEVIAR